MVKKFCEARNPEKKTSEGKSFRSKNKIQGRLDYGYEGKALPLRLLGR